MYSSYARLARSPFLRLAGIFVCLDTSRGGLTRRFRVWRAACTECTGEYGFLYSVCLFVCLFVCPYSGYCSLTVVGGLLRYGATFEAILYMPSTLTYA